MKKKKEKKVRRKKLARLADMNFKKKDLDSQRQESRSNTQNPWCCSKSITKNISHQNLSEFCTTCWINFLTRLLILSPSCKKKILNLLCSSSSMQMCINLTLSFFSSIFTFLYIFFFNMAKKRIVVKYFCT